MALLKTIAIRSTVKLVTRRSLRKPRDQRKPKLAEEYSVDWKTEIRAYILKSVRLSQKQNVAFRPRVFLLLMKIY